MTILTLAKPGAHKQAKSAGGRHKHGLEQSQDEEAGVSVLGGRKVSEDKDSVHIAFRFLKC